MSYNGHEEKVEYHLLKVIDQMLSSKEFESPDEIQEAIFQWVRGTTRSYLNTLNME